MADDKSGRDKQAQDTERRQRERALLEYLERWDETEPEVRSDDLGALESDLEGVSYPATGADVVAAVGEQTVDESHSVADLVADADSETFDSPDAVRVRVQRPTVASAMKRITEAAEEAGIRQIPGSQREAYEKTLRAMAAIDADDDDEGIDVVADWIVDRLREKGTLLGSRPVRRRAAKFCRKQGYEIRDDEWLGA